MVKDGKRNDTFRANRTAYIKPPRQQNNFISAVQSQLVKYLPKYNCWH